MRDSGPVSPMREGDSGRISPKREHDSGPVSPKREREGGPWSRDEWEVALADGAVYRIFRDRVTDLGQLPLGDAAQGGDHGRNFRVGKAVEDLQPLLARDGQAAVLEDLQVMRHIGKSQAAGAWAIASISSSRLGWAMPLPARARWAKSCCLGEGFDMQLYYQAQCAPPQ